MKNRSLEDDCIFFLDNNAKLAAEALFDTDLKSSILYLALLASCVVKNQILDVDWKKEGITIYQSDIIQPPEHDVRWLESTPAIWNWSSAYFKAMLKEHEYRFEKSHPSAELLELFESEVEPLKDQEDEFTPPPISVLPSKWHVDSNFRTNKIFQEKKGKGQWRADPLSTNRHLYKTLYSSDDLNSGYTKREVPTFIIPAGPSTGGSIPGTNGIPTRRWTAQ